MSREDFTCLIKASEHSLALRNALRKCKTNQDLITTAKHYGFNLSKQDFENESISESIESWFNESMIYPIRKL